jgi:hypothetical protein
MCELKITYYKTGEIESDVFIFNNKKEGIYKSYYKNGNIYQTRNYVNGILNGECNTYKEDGKLFRPLKYVNGILIEEHHVDVSPAKKTQLNEKQRLVSQSNSDTRDKLFETKQATEMFREKSLTDLLFCTTLHHSPMSRSSVYDIRNKKENQGYLRKLIPDKSDNWEDVGGKLVSSMSDAYSKNMSEASEAASRAQIDNDIIFALQNENASLASRNQLLI